MKISFSETVPAPWHTVSAVQLDVPSSSQPEPDIYILVEKGGLPYRRIDAFGRWKASPFKKALLWNNFLAVGYEDQVHLIEPETQTIKNILCDEYFGDFWISNVGLLIATASNILCVGLAGQMLWSSHTVGIDGVIIDSIDNGIIKGQGEWDPPGGWRPFEIDQSTGKLKKDRWWKLCYR